MPDNGELAGGTGVGADRRAAVRRGRAYMKIHGGRWCFYGLCRREAIGYERREAGGRSAGWELGLHREGVGLGGAHHSGKRSRRCRGHSYEAMDG
ncbi:hypothetical protein THAOC_25312 [Thalassiosira oceanica]|uniref:Uncharacterized protein n=1 Tax=Thalassiosira oceanica TaxID=159749 RepID=K0S1S1_THAOC|nr:hypothetical protein THAOC_25312 [Thalassiosira oceanica]|eukprot:EJK55006.1 hypothetical protein THAOC_25312 [Thalassiosira oceanica]